MGLFRKNSSCGCDNKSSTIITNTVVNNYIERPTQSNPNPFNYRIIRSNLYNNNLVAEIHYPDCTNYEGRKILLFKNCKSLSKLKSIDPHFCQGNHISPFARFEPTEKGWNAAVLLAKLI